MKTALQYLTETPRANAAARLILERASERFNIPMQQITSRRKIRRIAAARQCAIWAIRRLTSMSLPEIAQVFGFDHSTVHYSVQSVERQRQQDPGVRTMVDGLLEDARQHLASVGLRIETTPEPKRPTRQQWEAEADRRAQELNRIDPPVTLTREDVFRRRKGASVR